MFESVVNWILSPIAVALMYVSYVMVFIVIMHFLIKLRCLPILFTLGLMFGRAQCFVRSVEHNTIQSVITSMRSNWLCGNMSVVLVDDVVHFVSEDLGLGNDLSYEGCTWDLSDGHVSGECLTPPPSMRGMKAGVIGRAWFQCGATRSCWKQNKGCTKVVEVSSYCGKDVQVELDDKQTTLLCENPLRGWMDSDGTTHGMMTLPEKEERESFHPTVERCLCNVAFHSGPVTSPITYSLHTSGCDTPEAFGMVGNQRVCLDPHGIQMNITRWMYGAMNGRHDVVLEVTGNKTWDAENYFLSSQYERWMIRMISVRAPNYKNGRSCLLPGKPQKDRPAELKECFIKTDTCVGGCWYKGMSLPDVDEVEREANRRKAQNGKRRNKRFISLFSVYSLKKAGFEEDGWSGNLETALSDSVILTAMAKRVDINTADIKMLKKKLSFLAKLTWEGICSNGSHSLKGNITLNFEDGSDLHVGDWCNKRTFDSIMQGRPIVENDLSALVVTLVHSRLQKREMQTSMKIVVYGALILLCLLVLRCSGRSAYVATHRHVARGGSQSCSGPHRFSKTFSRKCNCGSISLQPCDKLVNARCNNRKSVAMCLLNMPSCTPLVEPTEITSPVTVQEPESPAGYVTQTVM
ncbi:MAG: glycoprotein [Salmon pescarenavirus 1]|uniref:Glycoprotein n=1 Tax=Salmon pescarenavirus 1 TaxID=2587489 RepID=A0A5B9N339_9VIRU|nr:MAG: glycoprotein [Salmon pescarenavirus 1]QEG08234.1 MAG: glycoprotein [Salmon pescarenavirus 1]